jgi:cellulose synthase/poly-beta-1,6-N-acetylglucosamine synthase-like glycosyltransferase
MSSRYALAPAAGASAAIEFHTQECYVNGKPRKYHLNPSHPRIVNRLLDLRRTTSNLSPFANAPLNDECELMRRQCRRARDLMKPRISVVMPVRDGARWLDEAIISVQAQTLPDFELIIIDDGSADDSPGIMETRARSDPRVRAIRQERLGLVAALNRGLTESRGQFIARLDADDLAHPLRLQHQSEYLDSHPEIGLLGTWAVQIDEQGSSRGFLKPPTHLGKLSPLLARANPFLHSSIMFRNATLKKVASIGRLSKVRRTMTCG